MFLLRLLRATAEDSLRTMREFLSPPPEPENHDGYLREDDVYGEDPDWIYGGWK